MADRHTPTTNANFTQPVVTRVGIDSNDEVTSSRFTLNGVALYLGNFHLCAYGY